MKRSYLLLASMGFFILAMLFVACQKEEILTENDSPLVSTITNRPDPVVDLYGNNLSFPVIWADGFEKTLREPPVTGPQLESEWWYVWADDPAEPTDPVYSCRPNPDNPLLCEDGTEPGDGVSTIYKVYLQKQEFNIWQAYNEIPSEPLNVDLIDWGDNLESIDWNIRSQVRTELVLLENLDTPVLEYAMRHVSGWGTNEMHGLQTTLDGETLFGVGNLATVYSHNSRLTIQKLNKDRDLIEPESLTWVPNMGWTETDPNGEDLINEPIYNLAVYEAGDGSGFYNAEVNIKGKIIYGYTWNVRALNDGPGYYRITFSFDENGGTVPLNTFFDENTEIIVPIEESYQPAPDRGGTAVIDVENNLTFMDIRIKNSGGGGGGGGGGGH